MHRRFALPSLVLVCAGLWLPIPTSPTLAQSVDPCVAPLANEGVAARRAAPRRESKYGPLGADTRDIRELLLKSSVAAAARAQAASASPLADRDDNQIAILEDTRGELITRPNPFDLSNTGLRFDPSGGGYAVTTTGAAFRSTMGRALSLGDDDSTVQSIGFPFEFYGRRFTSLFVNSDGNLTFEEGDNASTSRNIRRLVTGAPRIAPFFADLDPSAGGRVFLDAAPDAITVTWCAVPGFERPQTVTVQVVLFPNGAIEYRFASTSLIDSVVALAPGRSEDFIGLNLDQMGGHTAQTAAVGELFAANASLDLVATTRRFYQTHPDDFDQLVIWTDTPVISDAFAFESTVQNAITGTGINVFDFSAEMGSAGALQSIINMDRISKYPDAPSARFLRESSTLGVLAHETGHRWLARLRFRNADRVVSDQLLGRQRAHWSFFTDSDGSVMEGNEIEDLGGGTFRTASAAEKYSRLDLYAMGLATEAEVPRWFFIEAPISENDREDTPRPGVTITGTRRDVLIQDVVDALGPRVPSAADTPRLLRQAYVFVRRSGAVLVPADLARLERIRQEFVPFFGRATENRMSVRTTLTQ